MTRFQKALSRRIKILDKNGDFPGAMECFRQFIAESDRIRPILNSHPAVALAVLDLNRIDKSSSVRDAESALFNYRGAVELAEQELFS